MDIPSLHHKKPKMVVVAGAGVVGTSTAYFLAKRHQIPTTLVDVTGTIAPAASGKAAGFLARDWNDGTPLEQLQRRSFDLHNEIAKDVGASNIDYRRLSEPCAFVNVNPALQHRRSPNKKRNQLEWTKQSVARSVHTEGDEDTLAQVNPKKLCQALWERTTQLQPLSSLRKGKVVNVKEVANDDGDEKITHLLIDLDDGTSIRSNSILVACGPWSADQVLGSKGHSIVMDVRNDKTYHQSVFFTEADGGNFEGFARPDSTFYCSGYPEDPIKVTERPGEETPTSEYIERIREGILSCADDERVELVPRQGQACYQPTLEDGLPIIGQVSKGIYIAVGHNCWGVTMGPGTGEVIAHLIATGRKSTSHINLRAFDPARVGTLQLFC